MVQLQEVAYASISIAEHEEVIGSAEAVVLVGLYCENERQPSAIRHE